MRTHWRRRRNTAGGIERHGWLIGKIPDGPNCCPIDLELRPTLTTSHPSLLLLHPVLSRGTESTPAVVFLR